MQLAERISAAVNELKKAPGRIHHISIAPARQDLRCWVIPTQALFENPDETALTLAIYFSVNLHSKSGKRIADTVELLDLFRGYESLSDNRYLSFYKTTDNNSKTISKELLRITGELFPTIADKDILVSKEQEAAE